MKSIVCTVTLLLAGLTLTKAQSSNESFECYINQLDYHRCHTLMNGVKQVSGGLDDAELEVVWEHTPEDEDKYNFQLKVVSDERIVIKEDSVLASAWDVMYAYPIESLIKFKSDESYNALIGFNIPEHEMKDLVVGRSFFGLRPGNENPRNTIIFNEEFIQALNLLVEEVDEIKGS